MLDQLRKHAANWVVKAVLGVIIFTFIAFFGWSRVANRYQDAHLYVAVVEGTGIPRRKYENMLQESTDRLRQSLSGELPANMEDLLRHNVLDQLVTREVILRYAKDLGLTVSDREVAEYIRNNTGLFADGKFDLLAYEREFRPSYRQRTGEDFEDAIRRDLLIEKMQTLVMALYGPWESELDASLDEIQKKESLKPKTPETKKSAKSKEPESETAPLALDVTSASPLDLFADWVQDLRQKAKIELY